jgi:hypothetical protein
MSGKLGVLSGERFAERFLVSPLGERAALNEEGMQTPGGVGGSEFAAMAVIDGEEGLGTA